IWHLGVGRVRRVRCRPFSPSDRRGAAQPLLAPRLRSLRRAIAAPGAAGGPWGRGRGGTTSSAPSSATSGGWRRRSSPAGFFDDAIDVFASREGDVYFAAVPVADASLEWLRGLSSKILAAVSSLDLAEGELPAAGGMRLHCSLAWTLADLRPALAAAGARRRESAWGVSWHLPDGPRPAPPGAALGFSPGALRLRVGQRDEAMPFGGGAGGSDGEDDDSEEEEAVVLQSG
ncbi:unnamed protein product, partial [Prorocentrum cordatum]